MSLAKLKKQQAELLEKLADKANNVDRKVNTSRQDDERYWKPSPDASGNGSFTIRFLPAVENEESEFVHYWTYRFKWIPTGKFYYARSLSTLGKPDPVVEKKKEFRAAGNDNATKMMGRQDKYVSNILVIKDPVNPENEGKVFLFEYGTQVFNKIKSAIAGDPETEKEGFNPFDPWNGRNFILKIVKKSEFLNYENSSFVEKTTAIGKDSEIEEIWGKQYSLDTEIAEDKFETYEALKAKLDNVLESRTGGAAPNKPSSQSPKRKVEEESEDDNMDTPSSGDEVDNSSDIDDILNSI